MTGKRGGKRLAQQKGHVAIGEHETAADVAANAAGACDNEARMRTYRHSAVSAQCSIEPEPLGVCFDVASTLRMAFTAVNTGKAAARGLAARLHSFDARN